MSLRTWLTPFVLVLVGACGRIDSTSSVADLTSTNTPHTIVEPTKAMPTVIASTATNLPPTTLPTASKMPSADTNAIPTDPTTVSEPASEGTAINYVISAEDSVVSYGVGETFLNQNNRYNYAVGTTSSVSGQIMVDYDNPSLSKVGDITVDISTFKSDKARRDKAIRGDWLESSRYPLAVFSPDELRALPSSYRPGETLSFEIVGDLKVRDVSKQTTFTLSAVLDGEQLIGTATTQVQMTDFDFKPPSIAGILEAENDVVLTFEFMAVPATE